MNIIKTIQQPNNIYYIYCRLSEDWLNTKSCFKYLFSSGYYHALKPTEKDLENKLFHDKFYFTSIGTEKDFDRLFGVLPFTI
jgi:hypothetical protein